MDASQSGSLAAAWSLAQGVDVLAATVLAVGAVVGGFRGLTGELSRIGGLIVAVLVGYGSSALWVRLAAGWIPGEGQAVVGRGLVTLVGVAVTSTIAGQLTRVVLNRFLRLLMDQPADAVLGVVVGALRSALLIVLLLFLASFAAHGSFGEALFQQSLAGRTASPAVVWARERVGGLDPFAPGRPWPERLQPGANSPSP